MSTRRLAAVVDLEISNPIPPQVDARHGNAQVLLRLHGRPLGFAAGRLDRGRLDLEPLFRDILEHHSHILAAPLVDRALAIGVAPEWPEVRSLLECRPSTLSCTPAVTVAVRSSGDPAALRRCLDSLDAMDYRALDVVIIDGESADTRAIPECRGEVLIVMDDSVVLDRGWVGAAVRVFVADPEAMAVTGLVLPRRLATGTIAHSILERRWHRGPATLVQQGHPFVAAFWRSALEKLSGDTPETVASGESSVACGFSLSIEQLLAAGHTVVYEPAALAWHASQLVADPLEDQPLPASAPAVRRVDLADTPRSILDATGEQTLRLEVSWEGRAVGTVEIAHRGTVVSPFRIQAAIARQLGWDVLDTRLRLGRAAVGAILTSELARHLLAHRDSTRPAKACPLFAAPRPAAA